jgi:hypothetical protein
MRTSLLAGMFAGLTLAACDNGPIRDARRGWQLSSMRTIR